MEDLLCNFDKPIGAGGSTGEFSSSSITCANTGSSTASRKLRACKVTMYVMVALPFGIDIRWPPLVRRDRH
jgi:hypothetical protein